MWAAGGRSTLHNSCRSDPGTSNPNLMQEDGKGHGTAGHPAAPSSGEVIYFFLTSSASADFSNQAITCLQGKAHKTLGVCSGTSWAACREGCEAWAWPSWTGQWCSSSEWAPRGASTLPESPGSHRELFPRPSSPHGCRKLQHMLLLLQWAENQQRVCCALMGWSRLWTRHTSLGATWLSLKCCGWKEKSNWLNNSLHCVIKLIVALPAWVRSNLCGC